MNKKRKVLINIGVILAVAGIMVMASSIAFSFSASSESFPQFIAGNLWRFLALLLLIAVWVALYVHRLQLQNSDELRKMFESGTVNDIVARALASGYSYLLLLDADDDRIIYVNDSKSAETWAGDDVFQERESYSDAMIRYIDSFVVDADKEIVKKECALSSILKKLEEAKDTSVSYRFSLNRMEKYATVSASGIDYKAGKKYCLLRFFDSEEIVQRESRIKERELIIDALTEECCCVSVIDLRDNTIADYRVREDARNIIPGWLDTNNYSARMMLLVNQAIIDREKTSASEELGLEKIRASAEKDNAKVVSFHLNVSGMDCPFQFCFVPLSQNRNETLLVIRETDEDNLKLQQSNAQNAVISALTGDFLCVSYIDLIQNRIENYRIDDSFANLVPGWRTITDYAVRVRLLSDSLVIDADRERFLLATSPGSILRGLSAGQVYYVVFRILINDETRIFQAKYVQDPENSNAVVFGIHDVDAEKQQEMERQAQENAESIRSDFLKRLGSDLVQPLNEGQAIVDEIKAASSDESLLREQIIRLEGTAQKLFGIVNNIQNMTQTKTQNLKTACVPMNMIDFANDCSSAIADMPVSKNIRFETDIADIAHPHVLGDELRLRQIVQNLIENAIRFTPEGGKVMFRIGELLSDDETATFKIDITDTGSGMEQDILEHIWDIFTMRDDFSGEGNTDVSRNLAVSKTVADSIGATITVESTEGAGTNFSVLIPLALDKEKDYRVKDVEILKGLHVLLAEDNELNLVLVRESLENVGAVVTTVSDGSGAIKAFESSAIGDYNLILMDLMMPEVNGIEATKKIRALSRADADNVPIFALVANASDKEVGEARDAGINVFLNKPLQMNSLVNAMMRFINRRSQKLEIELANANVIATTDALTGVRNRTAFEQMETQINAALKSGELSDFAVVFCDLNDLKKTNDTEGHDKGDALIKKACGLICDIFKHSPVFRIGGDEFAVVLRGADYDARESLVISLVRKAYYGDVVIACGYAEYTAKDSEFSSVFKRADAKMYENKKRIKAGKVPQYM